MGVLQSFSEGIALSAAADAAAPLRVLSIIQFQRAARQSYLISCKMSPEREHVASCFAFIGADLGAAMRLDSQFGSWLVAPFGMILWAVSSGLRWFHLSAQPASSLRTFGGRLSSSILSTRGAYHAPLKGAIPSIANRPDRPMISSHGLSRNAMPRTD